MRMRSAHGDAEGDKLDASTKKRKAIKCGKTGL